MSLCKFFDALLEREQVAAESHAQEVAWFGAQHSILNSRRVTPQGQQYADQASTDIETLERALEGCKTGLRLSELHEQQRLDAIGNLKQNVEQCQANGRVLLEEKTALETT